MTTFDVAVKPYLLRPSGGAYLERMGSVDRVRQGFGLRLKAAREAKGLTQQQVADKFDVKKATVSAWETGVGVPDALRLRQACRAAFLETVGKAAAAQARVAAHGFEEVNPDALQLAGHMLVPLKVCGFLSCFCCGRWSLSAACRPAAGR